MILRDQLQGHALRGQVARDTLYDRRWQPELLTDLGRSQELPVVWALRIRD